MLFILLVSSGVAAFKSVLFQHLPFFPLNMNVKCIMLQMYKVAQVCDSHLVH